jgi:prepilin-type N-terminal cleavage/methylation domain-containing protein
MTTPRRPGFTLVELLVVIAILATLAGLLLASLERGRNHAERIACVNNLRQAGLAVQMYLNDHQRFPRVQNMPSLGLSADPSVREVLGPYASDKIFRCPLDDRGYFEKEGSSYEWNVRLNGVNATLGDLPRHPMRVADAGPPSPSETRVLWDYEAFHGDEGEEGSRSILYLDSRSKTF